MEKKHRKKLFILIMLICFLCVIQVKVVDLKKLYVACIKLQRGENINVFLQNYNMEEMLYRIKGCIGVVIYIYTICIAILIFLDNKNPSKTIAWLLVLVLIPTVGFLLYLFMGRNIRKKNIFKRKKQLDFPYFKQAADIQREAMKHSKLFEDDESLVKRRLITLMINNANAPFTINNHLKVLTNGEETFHSIIEELEKAKHHIHFEYFIIKDDEIGKIIKNILMKKAREGIEVRVMYDGVGSWRLSKEYLVEMRESGIDIQIFLPVYFPVLSRELNYRNHRKIIVIDGEVGFLGGLNIGDEYLGRDQNLGFWRDSHLKIEGEAVYGLQNIFQRDWLFVTKKMIPFNKDYYPKLQYCGEQLIQIASSGPDSDWESIMQGYFCIISSAEERIWINTPYLVPGESIMTALKTAALSGVDVRIILPNKPDHKTVFWATMSNIEELLEAGVRVYQYTKGFIHAKILLVDGIAASVGTANLDIRSFQINFEVNAFIYDKEVVARMEGNFILDIDDSREIHLKDHKNRPFMEKVKESTGKLFSPLL